jgi:PAS domain S-box-containing protein
VDTLDSVTSSWNELVDLTQRLRTSVQRDEANHELSKALERSSGGAVAEAINALPDGILYIADDLRFEYVNAAAQRLMGWNVDETKRHSLRDAQATGVGRQVLNLLRESRQEDGYFQPRTEVLTAQDSEGNEQSSYRVVIIPLQRSRQQGHCVAVVRDVSQQLRAERAREEFVAQVTHELRTPLTNIRAYTETLSSGMFEDPKVIAECYNVITKETRRLSRLIEDILSVSQLEVGSIELRVDNVDIKTLLSEALRDVRGVAEEKNIDVQLVLPAKLEPIRGDRDKLAVVVNNLLGNALKYTPKDGNVIIGCQVGNESVVLTFKDNGYGIDPKDHARVFEKFQRGSEPEVLQERGTGIGLYTAREIVRRHGGDIELISARQKGSTFMVRLPRQRTRSSSLSVTPVQGEGDAGGENPGR